MMHKDITYHKLSPIFCWVSRVLHSSALSCLHDRPMSQFTSQDRLRRAGLSWNRAGQRWIDLEDRARKSPQGATALHGEAYLRHIQFTRRLYMAFVGLVAGLEPYAKAAPELR